MKKNILKRCCAAAMAFVMIISLSVPVNAATIGNTAAEGDDEITTDESRDVSDGRNVRSEGFLATVRKLNRTKYALPKISNLLLKKSMRETPPTIKLIISLQMTSTLTGQKASSGFR